MLNIFLNETLFIYIHSLFTWRVNPHALINFGSKLNHELMPNVIDFKFLLFTMKVCFNWLLSLNAAGFTPDSKFHLRATLALLPSSGYWRCGGCTFLDATKTSYPFQTRLNMDVFHNTCITRAESVCVTGKTCILYFS